jgi:RNA polymerase sigma-70 factor (ECF subfamily)
MVPIAVSGQLGAGAYRRGDDDAYHPFAVVALATTSTHISRISLFADPTLFPFFDLPPTLSARP